MATIQEINSIIMFGNFTNDQLNSILSAVKFRRNQLAREAKRSFLPGSQVKFTSTRNGQTVVGTVEKVAIKYVTVRDGFYGLWKVPASMLEAA